MDHPAIIVAAEQLRPCDAWLVFETAMEAGGMPELAKVKRTLQQQNLAAYTALLEYESDARTTKKSNHEN